MQPALPAAYPPPLFPPPLFAPPVRPAPGARARGALQAAVATLALLALYCAVGDGVLGAVRAHLAAEAGTPYFVGDPAARSAALTTVLNRRASAVARHDVTGFLADVDQNDPSFVRQERDEYENLVGLGLSSFTLTVTDVGQYEVPSDQAAVARRYSGAVWTASVTVRYAISGLDSAPVAEPWVPLFGYADGRWMLAGESNEDNLPTGAGGLPWEARGIAVKRSAHVVAVVSADDQQIAPHLLNLAEQGLAPVVKFRPTGWSGKILVTAVSDRSLFRSYFRDGPGKIREVAAIAVPTYDSVHEWAPGARYVTTRVVFNPETLGDGDEELVHDLAHEFTHAAMGSLTSPTSSPLWLVEGTAEYVGYQTGEVDDAALATVLRRLGVPDALPADTTFYDHPDDYVLAWLACRMIAQRYGQARLTALYAYFNGGTSVSVGDALRQVLGMSTAQFVGAWQAYLRSLSG